MKHKNFSKIFFSPHFSFCYQKENCDKKKKNLLDIFPEDQKEACDVMHDGT